MDILNGFMQSVLMEAKKNKISKKQDDIKEEKDDSEDIINDSGDKGVKEKQEECPINESYIIDGEKISDSDWKDIVKIYNSLSSKEKMNLGGNFINSPNTKFSYIFRNKQTPVAFVHGYDFGDGELIAEVAVSPLYRGKGLAIKGMNKLESFARKNKFKRIVYLVKCSNSNSINLAKKLGYVFDKKENDHLIYYKTPNYIQESGDPGGMVGCDIYDGPNKRPDVVMYEYKNTFSDDKEVKEKQEEGPKNEYSIEPIEEEKENGEKDTRNSSGTGNESGKSESDSEKNTEKSGSDSGKSESNDYSSEEEESGSDDSGTDYSSDSGDDSTSGSDDSGTDYSSGGDDSTSGSDDSGDDSTSGSDDSGDDYSSGGDDSTSGSDDSGDDSTSGSDDSGDDSTSGSDDSGDDSTSGSTSGTDYSGGNSDGETDDNGEDTSDDSGSVQNDSPDDRKEKLKLFYLQKDMMKLVEFINKSIDRLSETNRHSFIEREVDNQCIKNFEKLAIIIVEYIKYKFDFSDYTENLYNYRRFVEIARINIEMVKKLTQSNSNR